MCINDPFSQRQTNSRSSRFINIKRLKDFIDFFFRNITASIMYGDNHLLIFTVGNGNTG